jgi:hypothetical protein
VACILSYKDARFLAVADIRKERREWVKNTVDKRYQNQDCATYSTHEELLARKDIDAVLIATGDRWHTPMSILAAKAGKDVYCEKPCSMTIQESHALADTFRRYGRIYQAGCQRRNGKNFVWPVNMAREGKLGKLTTLHANAGTAKSWAPTTLHDWLPAVPEPPKDVVDWDRWLGPTPPSRYTEARPHGGPALGVHRRGSGTVDRDYFASGSGRNWNFSTLLVVPLPPSTCAMARVA